MTKASQLKANPTITANPAAIKAFKRTPRSMSAQSAPAAAKLTHAARVKESTVPKKSHAAPSVQSTFDKVVCWDRQAMAMTGGSINASTAP